MSLAPPVSKPATSWRTLVWVLAPVIGVLLLRAWLQARGELLGSGLHRLRDATLVDSAGQALWLAAQPFVLVVLAGALALLGGRWVLRRWSWAVLRPWALGLWVMLWLSWGGWLLASHMNRSQTQALPGQHVRVLLAREVMPGKRRPGGVEVYFEPLHGGSPQRLLVEDQPLTAFGSDSLARLSGVQGRWWGRWAVLQPAD